MDEIQQLENKIKNKKFKNNLFFVIWDTLKLWLSEISNTVVDVFLTPTKWKNQISYELENRENDFINNKYK